MNPKPVTLLAFDPSLHATGWAKFHNGAYNCSGVLKVPKEYKGAEAVFRMWDLWRQFEPRLPGGDWPMYSIVVAEIQESRQRNERASANSLLLLNGVCFGFLAMPYSIEKYAFTPKQWKGTTPKSIHNKRVQNALDLHHITDDNELDAIGLGLYYLTGRKL